MKLRCSANWVEIQHDLFDEISNEELLDLVQNLELDEMVDILQNLPQQRISFLLSKMTKIDRENGLRWF